MIFKAASAAIGSFSLLIYYLLYDIRNNIVRDVAIHEGL